ncbi:MAG: hypothetical protein K2M98_06940, partial [Muribaculum sp.]|nr:hypothetical protein [Muribaculum sp.]
FNFRMVSDEVDNFRREINIDADDTFLSLRNAICDSVDYDKNQMSSFFLCDDNWEKGKEITLEDMGSDSSEDIFLMEETPLVDFIDDGQKLIFIFDYMTERCFFLEMKKSIPGQNLKDPVCVASMGHAPVQFMDLDEFESHNAATNTQQAVDLDEDFYGSDSYNDDEFDSEGFDEMTFDE